MNHDRLWKILQLLADQYTDGHFSVLRFTKNWRVGLGTPTNSRTYGCDATSFEEAALGAIEHTLREQQWIRENCREKS